MGFDLDRLERLAGGLAILFYVLLFLAFITAIMGSGGGGLLLLVLGGAAHVGRVGLEDFVERRREIGELAAPVDGDAGERATGLRLKWLPRELRLPRNLRVGGLRPRGSGGVVASSGEAAGAALGRVGEMLSAARVDIRASFAALFAEIKARPEGKARRSFDLPHDGVEDASDLDAGDDEGSDLDETGADSEGVVGDFGDAFEPALAPEPVFDFAPAPAPESDFAFEPELAREPAPAPEPAFVAERPRRKRPPAPDAPTAQERYEARQRARRERGETEPVVAAVEEAETQKPQRVRRRNPGGRPDPLQTRRPTRTF
jgi:hypothetical protein